MRKGYVRNMALTALFAAVITVCSQIAIPMPNGMPITLQMFGVALCGYILPVKISLASVVVWIALGITGVPVFSNLTAGLGKIVGATGGYIIGFIPFVALCGVKTTKSPVRIIVSISGLLICHCFGVIQYSFVMNITFAHSFILVSAPYIIKDVLLLAAAYILERAIHRRINFLK